MLKRKLAFTLIELLVVIAIIAILAAILFPVFAQAKAAAKKAADLSNTKQIILGVIMYAGDSDDVFPRSTYLSGVNLWGWQTPFDWHEAVLPYVKSGQTTYRDGTKTRVFAQGGIWDTPAYPGPRHPYQASTVLMPGSCMWDGAAGANRCDQNGDGTPNGNAPFPSVSATDLDAPANIAATWTVGINTAWGASGDAPNAAWWWWGGGHWPPTFDGPESGAKWDADVNDPSGSQYPVWAMPRYRYNEGLNAGFADGHGRFVKKYAFNWCKYAYIKGKVDAWGDNWDWLFNAGSYCSAYAR